MIPRAIGLYCTILHNKHLLNVYCDNLNSKMFSDFLFKKAWSMSIVYVYCLIKSSSIRLFAFSYSDSLSIPWVILVHSRGKEIGLWIYKLFAERVPLWTHSSSTYRKGTSGLFALKCLNWQMTACCYSECCKEKKIFMRLRFFSVLRNSNTRVGRRFFDWNPQDDY